MSNRATPITRPHVEIPAYRQLFAVLVASSAVFTHTQAATPEADCQPASGECIAVGRWNFSVALGAGVRTNPLSHAPDIPLAVIPQFSYYGKRFFIDNLDLGVTLAESDSNSIGLVASPGYDRVFFYRSDLQNIFVSGFGGGGSATVVSPDTPGAIQFPPRARRITYLAGPEWTFKYRGVAGQLDVLHEITAQNRGNEVRAALGLPLLEAMGHLTANIGMTWKSAAIVNYYYGEPKIYETGSAWNPFLKLKYARPLAGKWRLEGFVEYERLGSAIAKSPIVAQNHVVTGFVGAIYAF
jgi:outer membrane protein